MTEQAEKAKLEEGWRRHRTGDRDGAETLYRQVVAENPQNLEALRRLAFLLGQKREFLESERLLERAIQLRPTADALFLRAYTLQMLARYEESIACLDRALELNRDMKEAILNRASVLFALRRYEEAAADYQRLLKLDPDSPFARGNRLFCRLHCCDWRELAEDRALVLAGLGRGMPVIAPFDGKAIGLSPAQELHCARIWVTSQCPASDPLWRGERYAHKRIRIAYLSANFHQHAVAHVLAGVLESHDDEFETFGLSFGPDDKSAMRARIASSCSHFLDVREKSDFDIARLIREREIDIAVDLMGFTEGCRPGILAQRPAPVAVNYLGFPGTMGAEYIDYVIADRTVIPGQEETDYAEKLVFLPGAYLPAPHPVQTGSVLSRTDAGLPPDGFVFCSFNAPYKITPEMFGVWMRLLAGVKRSVLWLAQSNPNAIENLKRAAEERGIARERVIFAHYQARIEDHMARLRLADLFVDTSPYNAHVTALDALSAGVPVLTLPGSSFAGRVAASLVKTL
ncbi:MAG TPA: tetratricopeptide repeat protein, partial [Micropepsaceae bacterium]|nr:tetratricopeptide repeat protein [Micropepsaceae bacterium]